MKRLFDMVGNSAIAHLLTITALVFALALVISIIMVVVVKRYAFSLKLVDQPAQRKMHKEPMAIGGGVAMLFGFTLACLLGKYGLLSFSSFAPTILSDIFTRDLLAIGSGAIIVALLGLFDDIRDLSPWTKLLIETLVAFGLFQYGVRITFFVDNYFFSMVATCLWIIVITNAFNLLDNMDGLSAGVALISGFIFFIVALQTGQWNVVFILSALLGAISGFLLFNFPPAKIFMGDCGSLFIGYLMSVLTIYTTFYRYSEPIFSAALPLLVMAVPLFDTITVCWLRYKARKPLFKADKRHFSHRLTYLGMTIRQAVLVIYLITFATGISATLLYQTNFAGAIIIIIQIFAILMVIHLLEQAAADGNG